MRPLAGAGVALAVALALAACGASDEGATAVRSATAAAPEVTLLTAPPTTLPTTTVTTTPAPPPTVTAAAPAPASTAPPKPRTASPKPPAAPASCAVPAGVTAAQVVLVDGAGASATVRGCVRSGTGYVTALGPYAGHVGLAGVATSKREGDRATPAGVFPLRAGFGSGPNPGLALGWRTVDAADVWVDDPASSLYNTAQRDPAAGRWSSAEHLLIPQYRYAQVIGYNEARTPGLGSAIFLHVDHGGGTTGCVSLPAPALLAVLRWERAGAVIAITT